MENLDELLKRTVESVKRAVESEYVLGKPTVDNFGSVIMPVNKLSYGFVVGGGEYGERDKNTDYPYSAACGGGVTLTPIGFLVCGSEKRFISVDKSTPNKWIQLFENIITDKLERGRK